MKKALLLPLMFVALFSQAQDISQPIPDERKPASYNFKVGGEMKIVGFTALTIAGGMIAYNATHKQTDEMYAASTVFVFTGIVCQIGSGIEIRKGGMKLAK